MARQFLIYSDGACPGNGKQDIACMYGSFAVYEAQKADNFLYVTDKLHSMLRKRTPLYFASKFNIKDVKATNNVAEAKTLFKALLYACNNGLFASGNTVTVCSDSQIIINQLTGVYQCQDDALKRIYGNLYSVLKAESKRQGYDVTQAIYYAWIPGKVMKHNVIIGH